MQPLPFKPPCFPKLAIPEKKGGGGGGMVEDMEFPGQGYQRNSMWNFDGLIKNEVEFPRVTTKK